MKLKSIIFCLTVMLIGCDSDEVDDACTKVIDIPQSYFINNQSYTYNIQQEVSCDFPDSGEPILIEPPILENFTFEILSFTYISDTGNDTSVLQFEIQLNNLNDYAVNGFPYLTVNNDGLIISATYSQYLEPSCNQIEANSNCIIAYDEEWSHDLGIVNSVEIMDVIYYLTN